MHVANKSKRNWTGDYCLCSNEKTHSGQHVQESDVSKLNFLHVYNIFL